MFKRRQAAVAAPDLDLEQADRTTKEIFQGLALLLGLGALLGAAPLLIVWRTPHGDLAGFLEQTARAFDGVRTLAPTAVGTLIVGIHLRVWRIADEFGSLADKETRLGRLTYYEIVSAVVGVMCVALSTMVAISCIGSHSCPGAAIVFVALGLFGAALLADTGGIPRDLREVRQEQNRQRVNDRRLRARREWPDQFPRKSTTFFFVVAVGMVGIALAAAMTELWVLMTHLSVVRNVVGLDKPNQWALSSNPAAGGYAAEGILLTFVFAGVNLWFVVQVLGELADATPATALLSALGGLAVNLLFGSVQLVLGLNGGWLVGVGGGLAQLLPLIVMFRMGVTNPKRLPRRGPFSSIPARLVGRSLTRLIDAANRNEATPSRVGHWYRRISGQGLPVEGRGSAPSPNGESR